MLASGARIPVAPRVFEILGRDFAKAPEWLDRVAWSPATPRDRVERWSGLMLTCEQEIAVADFRAVDRWGGEPLLPKVKCPTLVVGGADDLMTPPALSHALGRAIPGSRVAVVPHAGHMVLLEQPEAVFGELSTFLATLS